MIISKTPQRVQSLIVGFGNCNDVLSSLYYWEQCQCQVGGDLSEVFITSFYIKQPSFCTDVTSLLDICFRPKVLQKHWSSINLGFLFTFYIAYDIVEVINVCVQICRGNFHITSFYWNELKRAFWNKKMSTFIEDNISSDACKNVITNLCYAACALHIYSDMIKGRQV